MDALEAIQKGTVEKPIFRPDSCVIYVVLGASVSTNNFIFFNVRLFAKCQILLKVGFGMCPLYESD